MLCILESFFLKLSSYESLALGVLFFFINSIINYSLLEIRANNVKRYAMTVGIAFLIYAFPYCFDLGIDNVILTCGFSHMLMSDIFEYSIFLWVPLIWIFIGQILALILYSWLCNIKIIFGIGLIFSLFYGITWYSKRYLNHDGMGIGDAVCLCGLLYFIPWYDLCFAIILSSFFAVFFAGVYFVIYRKKISCVPYVPFLYLGLSFIKQKTIYHYFVSLINDGRFFLH